MASTACAQASNAAGVARAGLDSEVAVVSVGDQEEGILLGSGEVRSQPLFDVSAPDGRVVVKRVQFTKGERGAAELEVRVAQVDALAAEIGEIALQIMDSVSRVEQMQEKRLKASA